MHRKLIRAMFLVIGVSIFLGVFLFGSPITKLILREKVSEYLEEKYGGEFIIDDVQYSFENLGGDYVYGVSAYPKESIRTIEKNIQVSCKKTFSSKTYEDNYMQRKWENEIFMDINPFVQSVYHNSNLFIYISDFPLDFELTKPIINIPKYNEVKDKIKRLYIWIDTNESWYENKDVAVKNILEIAKYLRINEYDVIELEISYVAGEVNVDKYAFDSLRLSREELVGINSEKDIEKLILKKKAY